MPRIVHHPGLIRHETCYNSNNRRVIRKNSTAFTLTELMVTTSVLAVLAAILFPVFRSAIEAAKRSHCANNYRQIGAALALYQADYDDSVPPVNYKDVDMLNPGQDQTWVQTLLPYTRSFQVFMCPADTGRGGGFSFAEDGGSGEPSDPWSDYYLRSLRSNLGYNYMYFSPLVLLNSGEWEAFPIKGSRVVNPAGTLVFIDSVWDRSGSGVPFGGGSWVVVPPCRYKEQQGQWVDTFEFVYGTQSFFGFEPGGWLPESSMSWLVYGGAWPWHRGRFNVMFFDGHVKSVPLGTLTKGCDVEPEWNGPIKNGEEYIWDLNE